jgi:hypothetical protein
VRQTGQSAREKWLEELLLSMKNLSASRLSASIIILAFLSLANGLFAQAVTNQECVVAAPPAGVIKGIISAGDRSGVLIVGGKTVYSNDTFTVTTRGHQVTWKVVGFANNQPRFARLGSDSSSPLSTSLDAAPNFDKLVMFLESEAITYKAASTSILKDKAVARTREHLGNWCQSNQLCVAGTLSDISMVNDTTASLRLSNVYRGSFERIRNPCLFTSGPHMINVPMTKDQAATLKAGYKVIISGCPSFISGKDQQIVDANLQVKSFVSFLMSHDIRFIGAIYLDQIKYDIFDPKQETVQ